MPLFTRRDREAVGTAGVALGLVALMFGFFAFVVAAHADNRKIGAPAGAVQVTLTEYAITPASISAPLNGKLVGDQLRDDGAQLHRDRHRHPHQGSAAGRDRRRST